MVTRYIGERITRNEDRRLLTGQALFVDDVELPRHAARGVRAQPARPRAHPQRSTRGGARGAKAWWRSTPRTTSATTGSPGRCSCRRRRSRTSCSTSAPRCRWPRTRCAMSASRSRWSSPRAATSPRTPLADIVVDYEPLPAVVDLEAALAAGSALRPRRPAAPTSPRTCARRKGDYAEARAARADRVIRRRFHYDRGASAPIETRGVVAQWDAARRPADHLGHHAGADPHPQRPGRDARPVRAPGARDRAVHRRRLRPEDHDVLPGGGAGPLGRRCGSTGRSSGSRTAPSTSSPPPRSAARSTTPRSRSPPTAASSASTTSSCTTPAPTIPTA